MKPCSDGWGCTPSDRMKTAFSQAAVHYDEAAVLARETGRRMAARLEYIRLAPTRLADIGCATGDGIRLLMQRYPAVLPLAVDHSLDMLHQVRGQNTLVQRLMRRGVRLLQADARALPLATASLDFIWSNLMLHWLDDPLPALREMHRTLATDGLLMFALFGPDTLKELREACIECGIAPPLRSFHDMHDIGDMLLAAGFADPVMDMEMLTMTYSGGRSFLRDQRHLGVRDGLLGQLPWRDWRRVFAAHARRYAGGALPMRFEIVYGHAWKPVPRLTEAGHHIIRIEPRRGAG